MLIQNRNSTNLITALAAFCLGIGLFHTEAFGMIGGTPTGSKFEVLFDTCTGTMIASNIILTAGHCVYGPSTERVIGPMYKPGAELMVNSFDGTNPKTGFKRTFIVKVLSSTPHPLWIAALQNSSKNVADQAADTANVADVGIIVLSEQLPVATIALPSADLLANGRFSSSEIVSMGAGCQIRGDDRTMGTLKSAIQPLLSVSSAKLLVGTADRTTNSTVGPCKRDSGGGAFLLNSDGSNPKTAVQIGVNSLLACTDAEALADPPTNHYVSRIDRPEVISWLRQAMKVKKPKSFATIAGPEQECSWRQHDDKQIWICE